MINFKCNQMEKIKSIGCFFNEDNRRVYPMFSDGTPDTDENSVHLSDIEPESLKDITRDDYLTLLFLLTDDECKIFNSIYDKRFNES